MPTSDQEQKVPKFSEMVVFFVARIMDAGLVPWVLVASFLLGLVYVLTRNLDSKDTLAFVNSLLGHRGVAWLGWVCALIEIPIAACFIKRTRLHNQSKMQRLEEENWKSRELLKKLKQSEFELKEK